VLVATASASEVASDMRKLYELEDGQGATEYGLVIALILLSLALTVGILATSITGFIDGVAALIDLLLSPGSPPRSRRPASAPKG
jgi:Flp pilus assembly pilin Flp